MPASSPKLSTSKKKRKIDHAAAADLQARINKAKAAAGPVVIPPASAASAAGAAPAGNRDIERLTLTQLEHETVRLEARLKLVEERRLYIMAATGDKRRAPRKRCSEAACTNSAQKGGLCRRHDEAFVRPRCSHDGCNSQRQKGGVCYRHGAEYLLCKMEGCPNKIQQGGLCCRHGAKVKGCTVEGCEKNATRGGLCTRHRGEKNGHDDDSDDDGAEDERENVYDELYEEDQLMETY